MTSAVTLANLLHSPGAAVRKDSGNDKGADFGLALENSQSEAEAPLFGNRAPTQWQFGSIPAIETHACEIDEDKAVSDQRSETDENIENEMLLFWQAGLIDNPIQKIVPGYLVRKNYAVVELIGNIAMNTDNKKSKNFEVKNLSVTQNIEMEKIGIENDINIKISNQKSNFEIDNTKNTIENMDKYLELRVIGQNDIKAGDWSIEPIGTGHMNNLTENMVELVFKGLGDEMPTLTKSGSLPNHDFQPKIGTKYLRLHLEPQDLGPLTLCLRNDADGLRVIVQTLATEVHQKLVEDKESILRELNEKGVLISDMQIQMHSGKDIQTASDVNEMSHRGSFDNKSSERGNSNKSDFAAPSDSDEQKKHSTDEKTLGTYI